MAVKIRPGIARIEVYLNTDTDADLIAWLASMRDSDSAVARQALYAYRDSILSGSRGQAAASPGALIMPERARVIVSQRAAPVESGPGDAIAKLARFGFPGG